MGSFGLDEGVRACGSVTGAPARSARGAAGLKLARDGLFSPRRGERVPVQMHGAFAVFGQVVVITWGCGVPVARQSLSSLAICNKHTFPPHLGMRGSQAGLPKQNDAAPEGERMHERISVAERSLPSIHAVRCQE